MLGGRLNAKLWVVASGGYLYPARLSPDSRQTKASIRENPGNRFTAPQCGHFSLATSRRLPLYRRRFEYQPPGTVCGIAAHIRCRQYRLDHLAQRATGNRNTRDRRNQRARESAISGYRSGLFSRYLPAPSPPPQVLPRRNQRLHVGRPRQYIRGDPACSYESWYTLSTLIRRARKGCAPLPLPEVEVPETIQIRFRA